MEGRRRERFEKKVPEKGSGFIFPAAGKINPEPFSRTFLSSSP